MEARVNLGLTIFLVLRIALARESLMQKFPTNEQQPVLEVFLQRRSYLTFLGVCLLVSVRSEAAPIMPSESQPGWIPKGLYLRRKRVFSPGSTNGFGGRGLSLR